MRKMVAFVAVIAVALAAPTVAGAGQGKEKYFGAFVPSGELSFVIKKTKNGKKVFNFKWEGFPLDCQGTPETSSDGISFAVPVVDRQFNTRAADVSTQGKVNALLKLKGKLVGKTGASGTMRIEGRKVRTDGSGRQKCDSGKVEWTAASAL